jgi:SAM-dependent methyltransferase
MTMDEFTNPATLTGQPVAATPAGLSTLNRACPVCGNSDRQACQHWCAIPEFEVLRCRRCGVTFINKAIDDNLGFGVDREVAEDPVLALKAASDFRRLKEKLAAAGLPQTSPLILLDAGCGMGTFLKYPRGEGWKVTGLELSPAEAAYARERRGLTVEDGSIESLPHLPAGSFDVVTMFGVIEHLGNPRGAAEECARLLRSPGLLVVQTPAEDGLMRRLGRFLYWASGGWITFQVKQLYQMSGGHSVCFSRRSIRELMARCGFEILSIERSSFGLRLLLMRFRGMPWPKRLIYSMGTSVVFFLGRMLGTNHMTVYAQKRDAEVSVA